MTSLHQHSQPRLLVEDISADPTPLKPPTPRSKHILVIGAGVTGLVTAWLLLDRGFRVTVVARDWPSFGDAPRLTSQVAGALWELPPAGCGPQALQGKLEMVQRWALESLQVYRALVEDPELAAAFGVRMRMFTAFHLNNIDEDKIKREKVELIKEVKLDGFSRGAHLFDKYGVNVASHGGLKDSYEHLSPTIDTDVCMSFLLRLVRAKGAALRTDTVHGDLLPQEGHLLDAYAADALVNAAGVWAGRLAADDTVYPLRGGVLRLVNDGSDFPRVDNAMVVSSETKADGNFRDMAFILPRGDDVLLLGSILHQDSWLLDLTPSCEQIREMRSRCEDLLPALRKGRLDERYPLAQGRRPMRLDHVRVEREGRKTPGGGQSSIVHAYGHGGAGWSFAFGSARDVVRLVQKVVEESVGSTSGEAQTVSKL